MSDQNEYPTFPKEAIEYGNFLMNKYQDKDKCLDIVEYTISVLTELTEEIKNPVDNTFVSARIVMFDEVKLYLNSL